MNTPPAMSLALPKPRRALWIVLITVTVLGIFTAFLSTWTTGGNLLFELLGCETARAFAQPWRLLTSGLLTSPEHWSHLILSLLGLYFLSPPLEERWGSWRFIRFLALSVVIGNLAVIGVSHLVPVTTDPRFHPAFVFGPTAAITAIAVAWSREFANSTVNLFFFLPLRGKVLLWITLGFCVLDLIYPSVLPEGVIAPFGGVVAGLLLGGSPSPARFAWLKLRLAVLRRRSTALQIEGDEVVAPKPKRRPRPGSPPLRVVSGGLEEVLKKRNPPKDKRYLN